MWKGQKEMIYGQDAPIAFPVADLYDSGMMQMYVQAARDQYQQGLRDYENFVAKYGDFSSPFKNDVDAWNNEIMGPTVNMIEAMYAQGIDPTRNAEARAMISRAMRTIPYEKAAIMRQNAKAGEEYLKARGALAAKGLYDKDYNDFWLREQGYTPFEEWDSSKGVWNITSPVEYKSLFDATNPWFKNLKPHELTKQQVIDAKHPYDPNYIYTGIPIDDLRAVTAAGIPGFMNSIEGRYYRDYVSKRLAAQGIEPTEEAVNTALAEDIVTANHQMTLAPSRQADRFAEMREQNRLSIQADKEKKATEHYYNMLEGGADQDGDGKISKQERKDYYQSLANGSSKKTSSGKNGHSHIYEMYTGGISSVGGIDVSYVEDPQITSMQFLRGQQAGTVYATKGGKINNAEQFMNYNHTTDSPGTLVKMFVGKTPNDNNEVEVGRSDIQRLYTADEIANRAHDSAGVIKRNTKPMRVDMNYNAYKTTMAPTGKIKTVYEKDGRVHTYIQVRTYKESRPTDTNKTTKKQEGSLLWYDTHITSRMKQIPKREYGVDSETGEGYIKLYGNTVMTGLPVNEKGQVIVTDAPPVGYFPQEQIDLRLDPKYELEVESMDVNMGRSMGDTASRTTDEARID